MSEIELEDLRRDDVEHRRIHAIGKGCWRCKAVDEITRLNAENEEWKGIAETSLEHEAMANEKALEFLARAEKAEALVDEMREGLEPFAKLIIGRPYRIEQSQIRRARALITKASTIRERENG